MGKKGGKKGKALQDLSDDEEMVDPLAANGGGADFGKPKKNKKGKRKGDVSSDDEGPPPAAKPAAWQRHKLWAAIGVTKTLR